MTTTKAIMNRSRSIALVTIFMVYIFIFVEAAVATQGSDLTPKKVADLLSQAAEAGDTESYYVIFTIGGLRPIRPYFTNEDIYRIASACNLSPTGNIDDLMNSIRQVLQPALGFIGIVEPFVPCRKKLDPNICRSVSTITSHIVFQRPEDAKAFCEQANWRLPSDFPSQWSQWFGIGMFAIIIILALGLFLKHNFRR